MRAFIISLSKIPSSIATAKEMIKPLKEYGFDPILYEGTYGDDAVEIFQKQGRTLHPTNHFDQPITNTIQISGPGAKGCFYSHYRLWEMCVQLNETIFVFEDDVKFIRPYYPVKFDDVLITVLGSWTNIYSCDPFAEPSCKPTAKLYPGVCVPGTPGYAITPAGAKKLVAAYSTTYTASDVAMRKSVVDIKIHSHLVGVAITDKPSLTKTDAIWKNKFRK